MTKNLAILENEHKISIPYSRVLRYLYTKSHSTDDDISWKATFLALEYHFLVVLFTFEKKTLTGYHEIYGDKKR